MAQAVYCTFCTAFPTSYKQFGDEFKEDLVQLINEWIAGWYNFVSMFVLPVEEQCIHTSCYFEAGTKVGPDQLGSLI